MSVACIASSTYYSPNSTTVRQFLRALSIALTAVSIGCLIYVVETYLFHFKRRLAGNPINVMMRSLGLAHFLVGWLFLFSSRRLRNGRAIGRLIVAMLWGIVFCAAFARWGGDRNPFLVLLFYGLFLLHEISDEAELFLAYGDGPQSCPENRAFLNSLCWAVSLLLIVVLVLSHVLFAIAFNKTKELDRLPLGLAPVGLGILMACCAGSWWWSCHLGRVAHGRMRLALAVYQPLLLVYAGLFTILVVGSILGSAGLNLIILVHVTAWLVFAFHQLGKRPAPPTMNPWIWARSTPTGFLVLHLGMALVVLILMGCRVHVWGHGGLGGALLTKTSFYYWSIMHICMSFGNPH